MWRDFSYPKLNQCVDDIRIRLATKDDASLISDYFSRNREYLRPFEPKREPAFFSEQGWRKKLIKLNEMHMLSLGFYCLIVDKHSGAMLGTVSFSNLVRFPLHACSVGYSLDEKVQGRGVMRKALKMTCDWMFHVQNVHRITASYMPHNKKSEAVLRAVGFEDFGYCKDYLLIDGVWQDHQLTALTNKNWRDKQK